MLAKVNRLRKKKDFERILKKGKSFKEGFIILKFNKNNSREIRFGFIVSRKVSKKATVRNKVKRRLRELMKKKIENLKRGMDIILISLPGIETRDFWELDKTLEKLLKRAGALNP